MQSFQLANKIQMIINRSVVNTQYIKEYFQEEFTISVTVISELVICRSEPTFEKEKWTRLQIRAFQSILT